MYSRCISKKTNQTKNPAKPKTNPYFSQYIFIVSLFGYIQCSSQLVFYFCVGEKKKESWERKSMNIKWTIHMYFRWIVLNSLHSDPNYEKIQKGWYQILQVSRATGLPMYFTMHCLILTLIDQWFFPVRRLKISLCGMVLIFYLYRNSEVNWCHLVLLECSWH